MKDKLRLLSMVFCLAVCLKVAAVTLGTNGTGCVCVLPTQPTAVEESAAEELAVYFERMGLARPPVVRDGAILPDGAYPLQIGWTTRAKELTSLSATDMADDEFVVRVTDGGAVLAGHPTRGTLYAVDHLLEKCGVRWWSALDEYIPKYQELELPEINERVNLAFLARQTDGAQFSGGNALATKVAWYNVHQKINFKGIPTAMGGSDSDNTLCAYSHTAERLVPDEAFFDGHRNLYGEDETFGGCKPEWFALRDGRRLGASEGQPCLTNPEVVAVAAQNIIKLIARVNPDCKLVFLTQNDNTAYCECPACLEAIRRLGNRADLNIQFVNEVGARVRRVYPQVELETFAYQYTLEPPKTVQPADFVRVQFCTIEANTAQPLTHPSNRMLLEALKGWTDICRKVDVWCYTTNFLNYGLIHPVTRTMAADIPLYHRLGVQKCFCEEGPESGQFSWFAVWRGYLAAHLMANPALDADALRDDFFQGYYGPAAEPLMRLVDLYETEAAASGRVMTCFQLDTAHWLKAATLEQGEALLREAEAAAPKDSLYAKRLIPLRACHDWTRLWRHEHTVLVKAGNSQLIDNQQVKTIREKLVMQLDAVPRTPGWKGLYFKMGMLPLDRMLPMLNGYLAPEPAHTALPAALRGLPEDDLIILPTARQSVTEGERGIADYKSPCGEATRLRLNSHRWVARIDLPALPPCGEWEILVEARLPDAVAAPKGTAVMGGVYALGTNFAVKTEVPIAASRLSRDAYRLFSLGVTDFHRDGQIYFAGVGNAAVPELLIGRVFLKRCGK